MGTSEKLLSDEIIQDAKKKAARALKKAERTARDILADAEKDAEKTRQKVLEAASRRADRVAESVMATLEQEVRRNLLDEQEAALSTLFEKALERLADKQAYDYPAVLAGLAAEAARAIDAEEAVLELGTEDHALATDAWLAKVREAVGRDVALTVADRPAPIAGGVIARSADGRLLYDNSFAARLRRLRPALRQTVAGSVYAAGAQKES